MIRFIAIALVALSVAGCAKELEAVRTGISIATSTYQNPVTRDDLYKAETVINVVVTGLVTYRRACIAGAADTRCRRNIEAMQVYTRPMPPVLDQVREFVKNNDQVNARIAYDEFKRLYANLKPLAAAVGINFGVSL
jgi:hypothetical protein